MPHYMVVFVGRTILLVVVQTGEETENRRGGGVRRVRG